LLNQLTQWLHDYEAGIPFPQVPEEEGLCPNCSFGTRCQRNIQPSRSSIDLIPDVAAIEEVSL